MADLIDRDALEPFYESGTDPNDTYADMAFIRVEHIENAPAVNRWISCSERLPEYGEYVLFIRKNCEVYVGYYDEKNTWNTDYQWFIGEDVTHWMPLPEPPKEDENE